MEVPTTRLSRGKGCQLSAMADRRQSLGPEALRWDRLCRFSPPTRPGYEATDRRQSLGPEGGSPPAKRASRPDCTSETCGKLVGTKVGLPWAGGLSWVTRLDFARRS